MKQKLVRLVRQSLPAGALHALETAYREGRTAGYGLHYGFPMRGLRIIGVTGTNGKTTTVNLINEVLKQAGYTTAMFSTAAVEIAGERTANDANMTTPDPRDLMRFFAAARKAGATHAVLEVSSQALDQRRIGHLRFEAAVLTNLTHDHLDYHGTMEKYAAAKGRLFAGRPRYIVLNRDDDWFDYFNQFQASSHKITYGKRTEAEARMAGVTLYKRGTEVDIELDGHLQLSLATALTGEYNAYNATAAAALCYVMGVELDTIREGIANLEELPGRYERVPTRSGIDVVVDFAHTPDGLEKLLRAARGITKGRVILVLGGDGDRDRPKRPVMGAIAARLADRIFLTDMENRHEEPAGIRRDIFDGIMTIAGGAAKTTEIADRREAIRRALQYAEKGDTVLMTGLGHEQFRNIDGALVPWNDGAVARELLAELGKA